VSPAEPPTMISLPLPVVMLSLPPSAGAVETISPSVMIEP